MLKLFIALFTIIPLTFVGVGTYLVHRQHHKITTCRPVEATVLSTDIKVTQSRNSDGRTSTSYQPIVVYRYEVDGRTYTCDAVTPLAESASRSWANEIVNKYKKGREVTAYYDPKEPAEAFLEKQYSFFPYMFILFPMLFFAVAAGVGVGMAVWQKKGEALPVSGGWFELRPTTRIADRRKAALIVAAVWHLVGVAAWGHYFRVASPPYETFGIVVTIIYEAIGLIPVVMFLYYFRLGRIIRDAYVLIDAERASVGGELTVHVEQEIFASLRVEELSVGLVCEKTTKTKSGNKTSVSSHECYEDREVVLRDQDTRDGEALTAEHTFRIPADQSPTTAAGDKSYPRYAWRVEVKTGLPGQPDYRGRFPVVVG
ncbi:MAG: DUF3592 domain-containing protein [Phycisphaerae bacterium]|nr:DUF3592 domain-containing protein [Phycisphaerae bacterium]